MADNRVMTAPLAVVKVAGEIIAKIKNLRISETIQRGRVSGLGQLVPDELPALSWAGTASFDFQNINFLTSQIPGGINRNTSSIEAWADNILLQEDGVQVVIYKKVKNEDDPVSPTGLLQGPLKVYATINGLLMDTEGFDIAEAQVSSRTQSYQYLTPILFAEEAG